MKTMMVLGEEGSEVISDVLNQRIVRELVFSEYSTAELSNELGVPALKIWRRLQKLAAAKMVEVVRVVKVRNIEKKVYRATATNFLTKQFLDLKPNDKRLESAFKTYYEIQRQFVGGMAGFSEIPRGTDPVDFSIYASMKSLCLLFEDPRLKERVARLTSEISEFEAGRELSPTTS